MERNSICLSSTILSIVEITVFKYRYLFYWKNESTNTCQMYEPSTDIKFGIDISQSLKLPLYPSEGSVL